VWRSSSQDCIPYEVDNSVVYVTPLVQRSARTHRLLCQAPGARRVGRQRGHGFDRHNGRFAGAQNSLRIDGEHPRRLDAAPESSRSVVRETIWCTTNYIRCEHSEREPAVAFRWRLSGAAISRHDGSTTTSSVVARRENTPGRPTVSTAPGNRQKTRGLRPDCMRYTVRHVMSVTF